MVTLCFLPTYNQFYSALHFFKLYNYDLGCNNCLHCCPLHIIVYSSCVAVFCISAHGPLLSNKQDKGRTYLVRIPILSTYIYTENLHDVPGNGVHSGYVPSASSSCKHHRKGLQKILIYSKHFELDALLCSPYDNSCVYFWLNDFSKKREFDSLGLLQYPGQTPQFLNAQGFQR